MTPEELLSKGLIKLISKAQLIYIRNTKKKKKRRCPSCKYLSLEICHIFANVKLLREKERTGKRRRVDVALNHSIQEDPAERTKWS